MTFHAHSRVRLRYALAARDSAARVVFKGRWTCRDMTIIRACDPSRAPPRPTASITSSEHSCGAVRRRREKRNGRTKRPRVPRTLCLSVAPVHAKRRRAARWRRSEICDGWSAPTYCVHGLRQRLRTFVLAGAGYSRTRAESRSRRRVRGRPQRILARSASRVPVAATWIGAPFPETGSRRARAALTTLCLRLASPVQRGRRPIANRKRFRARASSSCVSCKASRSGTSSALV
jgi:hypothetical protein